MVVCPIHWVTPALAQSVAQRAPAISQSREDALPENGGEIAMGSATLENCLLDSEYQPNLSNFGATVAIDGDYAVITSPYYYDGPGDYTPGGALLYRRQGTSWTLHGDLTPPPIEGLRGARGAFISGDSIVITDYNKTYIHRRNGTNWPLEAVLDDGWGQAVDGDVVVIGNSVYRRIPAWTFEARLAFAIFLRLEFA